MYGTILTMSCRRPLAPRREVASEPGTNAGAGVLTRFRGRVPGPMGLFLAAGTVDSAGNVSGQRRATFTTIDKLRQAFIN